MAEGWGVKIPGGWFEEEGHRYRSDQGVIVLSATQVFDALSMTDFGGAKQSDIEWKRDFGNATHASMQYLVEDDLDWDTVDPAIEPAVRGIEKFLADIDFELEAAEEIRVHSMFGMQYGMRLDLRGKITYRGIRRQAVIDLKMGSKASPTWTWQVGGAYTHPLPSVPGGWLALVMQVDPEGCVTPHYVLDVVKAQREFQVLLAAAILKVNNGLYDLTKKNGG